MAERKSAKAAAGSSSQNGSDVPMQGTFMHSHVFITSEDIRKKN